MRQIWVALALVASLVLAQPGRADDLMEGIRAGALGQHDRARGLLTPLAEAGNVEAQLFLALSLMAASPSGSPDPDMALMWLRRAIATGNGRAMATMAWWFQFGRGVPRNAATAMTWYDRAAAAGYLSSENTATRLLFHGGEGLPADPEAARTRALAYRRLLEARAGDGDVYAMWRLGVLLGDHPAFPDDEDAARTWLERAALTGDDAAQYEFARFLFGVMNNETQGRRGARQGRDVPTMVDVAVWLGLAAEQGYPNAEREFSILRARLSPAGMMEIERLIREHPARRQP